jgi:hypothetical protein
MQLNKMNSRIPTGNRQEHGWTQLLKKCKQSNNDTRVLLFLKIRCHKKGKGEKDCENDKRIISVVIWIKTGFTCLLLMFVFVICVHHILWWVLFCFFLRLCCQFLWIVPFFVYVASFSGLFLSSSMLPVSLDCPFLTALSVFYNVYLPVGSIKYLRHYTTRPK